MIKFDEFKKLDLRIAEIKNVEDIHGSDNLWKLKIEIGGEEREIVAGIKNQYPREQLIGRQIVVLANLEPKMLRGVESRGMLLAAEDGNIISILTPDKKVKTGSKIH